ncbi:MAG: hypothetical protein Q8936_24810 [Bacillota bacterium]|nr:hypothetical protein [Bacillota bacterium]
MTIVNDLKEFYKGQKAPWKASNIQAAIKSIQNNSYYRRNIEKLQKNIKDIDGKRASAEIIWNFINNIKINND